MKQFVLLVLLTGYAFAGSLAITPYVGVAIYYFYAILRPQYLWRWQLTNYPTIGWSFYAAAGALLGYGLWVAGFLSFGRREASLMRYRPAFTGAHWMMMIFAGFVCLSYATSLDHSRSEEWFIEYLKIFIMYYLASRVIRTPKQVYGIFMLVATALAYIALEANWIYLESGNLILYRRGFALLDNNGAGLLLALGVPLCYFAWEATAGLHRWLYLIAIPVIIHAVLCTYSRGAMLSMIAAAPLYILYTRHRKFMLLVYVGVAVALPIMAGKEIQARFFSIEQREADASYQSRLTSWRIATEIAWDYPIAGAGIRCSGIEMFKRGADMEGRTIHSQYLQVAADSGLLAIGSYLLMIAFSFWNIWRARRRLWKRTDPESRQAVAVLGGVECSIISYLVGAIALSLEVFEISYILFLLAAQVWALLHAEDTLARKPMPGAVVSARVPPPRVPAAAS